MSRNRAPERYFYHSFPRRRRAEGPAHGLAILELIRDFGLLMTPEVAEWQYSHADGTPPRVQSMVQHRISFTELAPTQLARHAREFGPFSLEFDIETLKELGAIPVFYVPQGVEKKHAGGLGATMVMHVIDAMRMTDRIAQMQAILESVPPDRARQIITIPTDSGPVLFDLDVKEARETLRAVALALAPPDSLSRFLEGTLNFFYPDGRTNAALQYYRQREWRMGGNVAIRDEEMMCRPSEQMIARLLALDADFFGRPFPPPNVVMSNVSWHNATQQRLVDDSWVFPGIGDKRILQFVRRVIAPAKAVEATRAILTNVANPPPVVSLESLSCLRSLPSRFAQLWTRSTS
jgi:hypothetical protein